MEQAEPAAAPSRTGRQELAEMLIDPPYDFNPAEMLPSDFGSFFLEEFPVARSTKALLADSPLETSLTVIEAERPGPTVFVLRGFMEMKRRDGARETFSPRHPFRPESS